MLRGAGVGMMKHGALLTGISQGGKKKIALLHRDQQGQWARGMARVVGSVVESMQ